MPMPLAMWNRARGVWETEQVNLLCGHSEPFSQTWPTSGMTRGGWAFELPTWEHPMDGSGSSSLPTPRATRGGSATEGRYGPNLGMVLLPSPTVSEANGAGAHGDGGLDLRTTVAMLPTPTTRDHKGRNQRDDDTCLTGALLPTPAVNDDMGEGKTVEAWDEWTSKMQAKHGNGNGHGASLAIEAQRLLPTPEASDGTGGRVSIELGGTRESGAKRAITLASALSHGVNTSQQ